MKAISPPWQLYLADIPRYSLGPEMKGQGAAPVMGADLFGTAGVRHGCRFSADIAQRWDGLGRGFGQSLTSDVLVKGLRLGSNGGRSAHSEADIWVSWGWCPRSAFSF